jgi:hypothetical protein
MSSAFFHKPELALRRAYELQGIHQSEAALTLLHDVLSSRRHRTWSPAYEQIMIAYLDLCLKLHRAREAKDGLHQYRNLAQSQAPGSLEKVIRYLLERAEDQCSRAKAAADAAATAASETPAPLSVLDEAADEEGEGEGGIGPQAILLSSMSTDPAKNQRDSLMLLPSLKFLWEIYRAVLDILRSNSKLEHVYHATSVSAFQFCRVYSRRTEFRRLCDLLRMHLGNLQKYGGDEATKPNSKVSALRRCFVVVATEVISIFCLAFSLHRRKPYCLCLKHAIILCVLSIGSWLGGLVLGFDRAAFANAVRTVGDCQCPQTVHGRIPHGGRHIQHFAGFTPPEKAKSGLPPS